MLVVLMGCKKTDNAIPVDDGLNFTHHPVEKDPYRKTKSVNGFNISVTYKPDETLVPKHPEINAQQKSLNFVMEIVSDGKNRDGNFLYKDAEGMAGFKQNVNYFNFSIIEDISVSVNGVAFNVVLSNMENTYTLSDARKIHFVAVPPDSGYDVEPLNSNTISFVYDDYMLGVGRTKFIFNTPEIKPIPNKL